METALWTAKPLSGKNLLKLNENIRLLLQRARRTRKKSNRGNVGIRAIACGWVTLLTSSVTGTGVTRALGGGVGGCGGWGVGSLSSLFTDRALRRDCYCKLLLCINTWRSRHLSNEADQSPAGRSCTTAVGQQEGCSAPCWKLLATFSQTHPLPLQQS